MSDADRRLSVEIVDAHADLAEAELQVALANDLERLAALGYDLVASTPKEFATRIVAEIEMWAKVIQAANIRPQ